MFKFLFGKDEVLETELIDKRLEVYEAARKLAIDEDLSEYRRKEKNRLIAEILEHTTLTRQNAQKMFKEQHEDQYRHGIEKTKREAELDVLEAKREAKKKEIEQAETDFSARGILRDRAVNAEREKYTEVLAERDKRIASLENESKTKDSTISQLIAALSSAAVKEAVTKVVGFGPSSEPKKV